MANAPTLTEFLVSKAMQKREDAKKADASQSQTPNPSNSTSKPADSGSSSGQKKRGMFGGVFSSLSNLFSNKKPESISTTSVTKQKQPRTSGGATGLAKILSQGFGSLTADTLGLSGSLSNITSILNQSLQANSSTATSVTTLTSILSDQLENQTQLLDAANVVKPAGRAGKFAGAGGKSVKASGQTLTEYIAEKVNQAIQNSMFLGGGAAAGGLLTRFSGLLTNPMTWGLALATVGSIAKVKEQERMQPFVKETQQKIQEENAKEDTPWYHKLGLYFANDALTGPNGPGGGPMSLPPISSSDGGVVIPSYSNKLISNQLTQKNIIKNSSGGVFNILSNFSSGKYESNNNFSSGGFVGMLPSLSSGGVMPSLAAGGANVMIGEAAGGNQGEVVQDLRSSGGKKMMGGGGGADPGMKTSGAATLTVIDQLIQSMGDKGPAVAQALGPDISNLSKEFGMSQTLPNIRIGGGKFKQDGNTKKQRDAYLEKLIAGSLSGLNAKKEGEGQVGPSRVGTGGPGTEGTPEQRDQIKSRQEELFGSLPGGFSTRAVTNKDKTTETIFESKENIAGGKFYKRKDSEGNSVDVMGPGPNYRPIEETNGERWYDQDGNLYSWKPGTKVRELKKDEMVAGWNGKPFIRKPDSGHVRVNNESWSLSSIFDVKNFNQAYQDPPAEGEYSYKFGKTWAKGTTGEMKDKIGWLKPSDTYGGRAPSLPNPGDIKFESGGQVQVSSLDWSKFVDALAPYSDMMSGKFDVSGKMTPPSSYNVKNYVTTSSPSATATDQTESGISTATIINMVGGESSGAAPIISTPPDQTINSVRSAFPEYSSVATLCTTRHIIFA